MSDLPFDKKSDKQIRKYQCFVCGLMFPEFEKYKDHILDKHEEGREYVVCPVQHCMAPVRDLRSHFKVKHPTTPYPKTPGMSRALIWKDFNPKAEKGSRGKTQKPKFREGEYMSNKMQKTIHYRSGYEAKVYEYLDQDAEVLAFDGEGIEIPYIFKGQQHKYIPDITVHFTDGRTELWEIKPAAQTMLEKNKCKWYAAGQYCQTRGWEFTVLTEVGIDKLKMKVKTQFDALRAQSINSMIHEQTIQEASSWQPEQ